MSYYKRKPLPITTLTEYLHKYRYTSVRKHYNWVLYKKRWLPWHLTCMLYATNLFLKCTQKYITNIQITPTYFFFYKLRRLSRINRFKKKWYNIRFMRKKRYLFNSIDKLNYLYNLPVEKILSEQQRVLLNYLKVSKCLPKINKNISYFYNYIHNISAHRKKIHKWIYRKHFGLFIKRRDINLHFYYLSKLKKYTDCFYVVNKFIYWYSYLNTTIFRTVFLHSLKYNTYKSWYTSNFLNNYNNVISVLKTYNYTGSYISNTFLNNNTFRNSFLKYLSRKQQLFSYNFWFRIVTKKPSVKMYNNKLLKKLNNINNLRLTSIKHHTHNTYAFDISTLFYNKLNNRRFVDNLDEKYYTYMKDIMLSKSVSKQTNIEINTNKHKNVKGIFPLLLPKNYYYNFYFFFNINKTFFSNRLHMFFYNANLFKCSIFILKSNSYYFFKDFSTNLYKMLVYKKALKVKKHLLFHFKPTGFLKLWYILISRYRLNARLRKLKLINTVANSRFKYFQLSMTDWYNMLSTKILNNKAHVFKQYKLIYKSLYKNFVPHAKRNIYMNTLLKKKFKTRHNTFINNVKANLLRKHKNFKFSLTATLRKFLLHRYKYFCYIKLIDNRVKIRRLFIKPSFFTRKNTQTSKTIFLKDQLLKYCSSVLSTESSEYSTNKYFQHVNKGFKYNNLNSTNESIPYVWSMYIKNANLTVFVIKQLIFSLFKLVKYNKHKKKYRITIDSSFVKDFYKNIKLYSFFESKVESFTDVLSIKKNVYNTNKRIKDLRKIDMYTLQSKVYNYISNVQLSLFFTTSVLKNKYKCIFMSLKSMLVTNYLTDVFATYKNHILIYKLVANKVLITKLSGTVPKLLNILDMSITDILYK